MEMLEYFLYDINAVCQYQLHEICTPGFRKLRECEHLQSGGIREVTISSCMKILQIECYITEMKFEDLTQRIEL